MSIVTIHQRRRINVTAAGKMERLQGRRYPDWGSCFLLGKNTALLCTDALQKNFTEVIDKEKNS